MLWTKVFATAVTLSIVFNFAAVLVCSQPANFLNIWTGRTVFVCIGHVLSSPAVER
jgi:hypothetical protein